MISSYLVKGANVLSVLTGEYCKRDILVENGIVTKLDHGIRNNDAQKLLDAGDLTITPGWVD